MPNHDARPLRAELEEGRTADFFGLTFDDLVFLHAIDGEEQERLQAMRVGFRRPVRRSGITEEDRRFLSSMGIAWDERENENERVYFQASDGSYHSVPAKYLWMARDVDRNLTVIQWRKE